MQRELMAAGIAGGQVSAGGSPPPGGEINAATGATYTEDEWRLRKRCASKRWSGAAGRFAVRRWRRPTGSVRFGGDRRDAGGRSRKPGGGYESGRAAALQQALDAFGAVTTGLEDEAAKEAEADLALLAALRGPPTDAATPAVPATAAVPTPPRDYTAPPASEHPKTRPDGNASMRDRFWRRCL